MKSGNKLNKALKDALNEHPVPLHDAQWERIRLELEEKKRRPIWWFLLPGILLLGLIGGLVWQLGTKPAQLSEIQKQEIASNPVQSESNPLNNQDNKKTLDQEQESNKVIDINQPIKEQVNTANPTKGPSSLKSQIESPNKKVRKEKAPVIVNNPVKSENLERFLAIGKNNEGNTDERFYSRNHDREPIKEPLKEAIDDKLQTMAPNEPEKSKIVEMVPPVNKDSMDDITVNSDSAANNKGNKDPDKDDDVKGPHTRFVLGFASGFSWVKTSVVGLTNQEYMHKDTRKVFEAGNDNQRSLYFNFSVEYKFGNLGLKVNSGLQYRAVQNDININYRLSELPWRNSDNTIAFYVKVPDSSSRVISLKSQQSFNFITLPFQLSYNMPINKKWEMLFNAGVNVSALIGISGFMVDLDANGISESSKMLKQQVTLGYTGGLQLSRQLYNRWWLGLEYNVGTINLNYDLGYGSLRSRIMSNNLNMQLRYKL